MLGTDPSEHLKGCPYIDWYDNNARWQPNHPLSEVTQEVMAETLCTCASEKDPQTDGETMNREDILNMPAGKKMNQFVWWKVFDMTPEPPNNDMNLLPDYSADIAAAWQVVNRLRNGENGFRLSFYNNVPHLDNGWYACFEGQAIKGVFADSAPLAICRAALLVVGEADGSEQISMF